MKFFSYLTLKTNGDVQQAIEWLQDLADRYGIFDTSHSVEEFLAQLRARGIIEERDGVEQLTARGVRKIRQDALLEIFSSLKKAPLGNHALRIPAREPIG